LIKKGVKTVSIAARNLDSLITAKKELETFCQDGQSVEYYELDVTAGYEKVFLINF
jgi:hypothetical protein